MLHLFERQFNLLEILFLAPCIKRLYFRYSTYLASLSGLITLGRPSAPLPCPSLCRVSAWCRRTRPGSSSAPRAGRKKEGRQNNKKQEEKRKWPYRHCGCPPPRPPNQKDTHERLFRLVLLQANWIPQKHRGFFKIGIRIRHAPPF